MSEFQHEKTKKQIWLLRHAQTEWSVNGRHTGAKSDIPLTQEGEDAARALKPILAAENFALVLTSPLSRAKRTAELAGLLPQAEIDADLLEWDYGDYEGITTSQIREQDPGWTIWSHPCPNGETPEAVAARARRVIDRALAIDGNVALFSHGHYLRVFAATWLELSPHHGADFTLSTATISTLGFEHEYRTILHWNERIA